MEQGTDPVGHNILPRNPTTVWLAFAGQSFCCFLLLFVSFYLHCVLHSWSDTFSIGLNLLQECPAVQSLLTHFSGMCVHTCF